MGVHIGTALNNATPSGRAGIVGVIVGAVVGFFAGLAAYGLWNTPQNGLEKRV